MVPRSIVLLALPLLSACAAPSDSASLNNGLQHEATCAGIDTEEEAKLEIRQAEARLARTVTGFAVTEDGVSWTAREGQRTTPNGLRFAEIKSVDTWNQAGDLMVRFHFTDSKRKSLYLHFDSPTAAKKAADALWFLCAKTQGLRLHGVEAKTETAAQRG